MIHLYDSSPYSKKSQTIRLKAAGAVSAADIKSLVWGEDALAFVYFVPANLSALHLVVADQDVHVAFTKVTDSLPYEIFTGIDQNYNEFIGIYPDQPRIFPNSVYLQVSTPVNERDVNDPDMIFIHPQSQFYLDIQDDSRSLSLAPFPDDIRFPTRTAFLDAMIATILDPPSGQVSGKLGMLLKCWISYFLTYTLRNRPRVLPTGDLEPEHAEVLSSLRPENRPYFDDFTRGPSIPWKEHVLRRKEVLEKLGCVQFSRSNCLNKLSRSRKYEEARRPLPLPPPGNPALLR